MRRRLGDDDWMHSLRSRLHVVADSKWGYISSWTNCEGLV